MKIFQSHQKVLAAGAVIIFFSLAVSAQDYSVVAGKSVGQVRLGDARAATLKILGKPTETKHWRSGLIRDSWLGPEPAPNSEESQIFFKVIYRAARVVQVEFNDPKYKTETGISIESTLTEFRAKYKRPQVRAYVYDDGEGSGFVGYYYDDVRSGIAFSFGTQDYFDATMIPEALRVHAARQPVIIDPGGKPTNANDEKPIQKTKTQTQHATKSLVIGGESAAIETVIRQFWLGLGQLDSELMKGLLDWPVTVFEASETGNRQNVIHSPQEFDDEFKRTPEAAVARGKSEFFGSKLSSFNVQMLNTNLASVSYVCLLPKDIVAKNPTSRSARFNALTVLRRDPARGNQWRIVFVTVPR